MTYGTGDLFEPPKNVEQLILRDYQEDVFDLLRRGLDRGHRRQILCAPTGSGKGTIGVALLQSAVRRMKQSMFAVDRIDLVNQQSRELSKFGVPHGVRQGETSYGYDAPVHVWSSQTLEAAMRKTVDHNTIMERLRRYDLVIYDEAHAIRRSLMDALVEADVPVIGLSATPFTKGLGRYYSNLVNARTTDQLVQEKWLVPFKVFIGTPIDMTGAAVQGGEWTDATASERATPIFGDAVAEWRKYTLQVFGNRHVKTIAFTPTVADGADLCRQFGNIGIKAEQVSYLDKGRGQGPGMDERRDKITRFRDGDTEVLVSVDALGRGFDVPHVECVMMLRPFRRAVSQVIQQMGRGARIAPGKTECIERSQRVLTQRGLTPIYSVRDDDLLWDGVEWVSHGGAICKGRQEVIEYAGITGTPDHKVWTRRGWVSLREARDTLEPICKTGAGRSPIRLSADRVRAGRLSRRDRQPSAIRTLSVHDLWLQIHHRVLWLKSRAYQRLSSLRQKTRVSEMALEPMQCSQATVRQSERQAQRWSLRAGKHQVGQAENQYAQQAKINRRASKDARVSDALPRDSVCRLDPNRSDFQGPVRPGDNREIQPTFPQTEGEVWDILNAGPRNRFTCEGLLVSNCLLLDYAQNYTRFALQIETFWAQGLQSLNDSTLKKLNEPKTVNDPQQRQCRECTFVIPKGASECPMCGWKPQRKSTMVSAPGTMTEYTRITDELGDIWPHCCRYALDRYPDDSDRAHRYALAQYKNITGQWPSPYGAPRRPFAPGDTCDPRIAAAIKRNISEYIKKNAWKRKKGAKGAA